MTTSVTDRVPALRVAVAEVTSAPLDVGSLAAMVEEPAAGAVVTFTGVVRDHDHGRGVVSLEYVAHPSAQDVIARVAEDVTAHHHVDAVAVVHRVGVLSVGDVAIVVAVASAHRAEAFAAASALVDAVKAALPVWKKQTFDDGSHEWVNCP